MKRIEDISSLEMADLERIADDAGIEVPEGLEDRLLSAIMASSAGDRAQRNRKILKFVTGAAATGIAACLAVMIMTSDEPKDTFDDPVLAYAELERTMSLISAKMERGMEIAAEAVPAMEMTERALNGRKKPYIIMNNQ